MQCLPRMPENGCADSEAVYGCSTFSTRRELRNTQGLPIHDCVNSHRGSLFYISIGKCDYTFVRPIHAIGHHACARLALSVTANLSLSIAAMALDSQTAMIGGIAPRARTQESPARAHSPWGKGRSPCAWVAHIATLRIEALRPRATAQPGARKGQETQRTTQARTNSIPVKGTCKCVQIWDNRKHGMSKVRLFNYYCHSDGIRISRRNQPRPNGSLGNSSPRLGGSAGFAALSTRWT